MPIGNEGMPQGMPQGIPQGMPPQGMPGMPAGMPPGVRPPGVESPGPETPPTPPTQQGGAAGEDMKKRLLQKLMSDILNKPGRSINEIINGVKSALGAYKNYSKELDTLNGVDPAGNAGGPPTAEQRAKGGVIESWDKPNQ